MTYIFKVQCGKQIYAEEVKFPKKLGLEEYFGLYYDLVHRKNSPQSKGSYHPLFGLVECFEQSDNCPNWYDRNTARFSFFEKIK